MLDLCQLFASLKTKQRIAPSASKWRLLRLSQRDPRRIVIYGNFPPRQHRKATLRLMERIKKSNGSSKVCYGDAHENFALRVCSTQTCRHSPGRTNRLVERHAVMHNVACWFKVCRNICLPLSWIYQASFSGMHILSGMRSLESLYSTTLITYNSLPWEPRTQSSIRHVMCYYYSQECSMFLLSFKKEKEVVVCKPRHRCCFPEVYMAPGRGASPWGTPH